MSGDMSALRFRRGCSSGLWCIFSVLCLGKLGLCAGLFRQMAVHRSGWCPENMPNVGIAYSAYLVEMYRWARLEVSCRVCKQTETVVVDVRGKGR